MESPPPTIALPPASDPAAERELVSPPDSREIAGGVAVEPFDISVENFMSYIDHVAEICNERSDGSFLEDEIKWSSSMVTFLKEWKQLNYEPKTMSFGYEAGHSKVKGSINNICLSQFSSAVVPMMEQSPGGTRFLRNNDFVLNTGGSVWALDWCPRTHKKHDGKIKCEFLAVAAHPPGSSYHKVGAPLVGRGVIQIWCLVTQDTDASVSPILSRRGRSHKKKTGAKLPANLEIDATVAPKKPRGRPRKNLVQKEGLCAQNLDERAPAKRPRGRPRKAPPLGLDCASGEECTPKPKGRPRTRKSDIPVERTLTITDVSYKEDSPNCNNDLAPRQIEFVTPLRVEFDVAPPLSVDSTEKIMPKLRGRPSKRPRLGGAIIIESNKVLPHLCSNRTSDSILPMSECMEVAPVSATLNVEATVTKRRGRPRKNLLLRLDMSRSRSEEVPASVDLEEDISCARSHRRRQRKKQTPSSEQFALTHAVGPPFTKDDPNLKLNDDVSPVYVETSQAHERSMMVTCDGFDNGGMVSFDSTSCIQKQRLNDGAMHATLNNNSNSNASFVKENEFLATTITDNSNSAAPSSCQRDEGFKTETMKSVSSKMKLKVNSSLVPCAQKKRTKNKNGTVSSLDASYAPLSSCDVVKKASVAIQLNGCKEVEPISQDISPMSASKDHNACPFVPSDLLLPRLVLCVGHNGKVAWDIKWRPCDVDGAKDKDFMGYLAVLLGNGALEVWEVPFPGKVKSLYASFSSEGTDLRFLKLEPAFRCSMVKCADRQSIPLTLAWSSSASGDLILAGCHDGTVALWKFSPQFPSKDTRPLLCFAADTAPIRAIAWAPDGSNADCANLVATAGHEGLKFWDLRNPYHPLWHINPQSAVLDLDWLRDPGCIVVSLDDGTVRTLSLRQSAYDAPFNGELSSGSKKLRLHTKCRLPFAVWSVQVSRATGLAAYCSADGSAFRFQVTARTVDKPRKKVEEPHFLCGSIIVEGQTLMIKTQLDSSSTNEYKESSQSSCADTFKEKAVEESELLALGPGPNLDGMEASAAEVNEIGDASKHSVKTFPPKIVALHRIRWNMNRGSERWLCYGGAAGIIRCQEIGLASN